MVIHSPAPSAVCPAADDSRAVAACGTTRDVAAEVRIARADKRANNGRRRGARLMRRGGLPSKVGGKSVKDNSIIAVDMELTRP